MCKFLFYVSFSSIVDSSVWSNVFDNMQFLRNLLPLTFFNKHIIIVFQSNRHTITLRERYLIKIDRPFNWFLFVFRSFWCVDQFFSFIRPSFIVIDKYGIFDLLRMHINSITQFCFLFSSTRTHFLHFCPLWLTIISMYAITYRDYNGQPFVQYPSKKHFRSPHSILLLAIK